MKDRLYKWLVVVVVLLILTSIATITPIIYIGTSHRIDYKKCSRKYTIQYTLSNTKLSKTDIKAKVDKLFGNIQYSLCEVDFKGSVLGDCSIIEKNIRIDKNLSLYNYTFTLVHELVHLKYHTKNERFCEFQAFKMLFESGDEFLVNVARKYANYSLSGASLKEYDCSGYIENYLKNSENCLTLLEK